MGRFSKLDFQGQPPAAVATSEDPWPNMDAHACLKLGEQQYQTGHYEPALTAYSRALRFDKGVSEAWIGQVRSLICLEEFSEAVTWSDRALEKFFGSPDLLACKGMALVRSGRPARGMECLDEAIELRSPSCWVWHARGDGLLRTGQGAANAKRCFLKAQEIDPQEWRLEMRIGISYNEVRKFAEARPYLLAAARSAPGIPLLMLYLGTMHEGLGEISLARGFYERALAARRGYREAQTALDRVSATGVCARLWQGLRSRQ
ncbi:MAG: Tetratricopeptide repeat protein [Capsulimonas sp.]|nr:Tetratricopeptide repeat protein [Capsulimonas sp.]